MILPDLNRIRRTVKGLRIFQELLGYEIIVIGLDPEHDGVPLYEAHGHIATPAPQKQSQELVLRRKILQKNPTAIKGS